MNTQDTTCGTSRNYSYPPKEPKLINRSNTKPVFNMWEGTICCLRNSSVSLEIMPAIVTHISCVFENFESYFLSWLRLSHCREPLRVDCLDLCISVFYSLSLCTHGRNSRSSLPNVNCVKNLKNAQGSVARIYDFETSQTIYIMFHHV